MVTTSTSWDVTPTTHGDVVIWPTLEHGLWSNMGQVIGCMLILKINENPSPYLRNGAWKMVRYNQHTKKIQVEARTPQTLASKYVSLVESNVACSWRYWGGDDHHHHDDDDEEDHKDQDQDQEEENYGICPCLFHTLILTSQPSQPSLVARLWPLPVRSEVGRHGLEI